MLREPIGEYKVGITRYETPLIGEKPHQRAIPMTIFFPSEDWTVEAPYQNSKYQMEALDNGIPEDNGVHTFCGLDVRLTSRIDKFPVILYNHGLTGNEMESTVLCADLASSGFVVVSVGHPYGAKVVTYPDGRGFINPMPFEEMRHNLKSLEPLWYEDMCAAIDFLENLNMSDSDFKGRLLLETLGTIGVSYGGCCGVAAALKSDSIKYAVNLDGSMFVHVDYKFINKPVYVMCSPVNVLARLPLIENGLSNLKVDKIRKVSHFEFSDGIYFTPKGRQNREWADRISKGRAENIINFIREL